MLSALQSYWQYGTNYCAIECTSKDGGLTLNAVTAKRKKNEFVEICQESANSFEALSAKLPNVRHSMLVINTDKVLVKKISKNERISNVVNVAFPGIDLNNFYYQVYEGSHQFFVSVIKKNEVDTLIRKAESNKIQIVGFRIGFGTLEDIIPLINQNELVASNRKFEIENGKISGIDGETETIRNYTIEDILIDSNHLICLAGLFGYVNPGTHESNIEIDNSRYRGDYIEKNFFNKGLKVGIGLLLFLSLLNFLFFSNYRSEYSKLTQELDVSKSQSEVYKQRKQALEVKEKKVSNILKSGNSKTSYYVNRLVSGMPESMLLNEITYQPLLSAVRPDKPIEAQIDVIIVSGSSSDKNDFSTWVKTLESYDWIENVTPLEFRQSGSFDSFSLNLKIVNDTSK